MILARRVSQLPTAAANLDGHLFVITDGADPSDASTGGGTYLSLVVCDGSGPTWKVIASLGTVHEASALTNNTVPVADSNGHLEDGSIYDDGTNVGIGTSTPATVASGSASGLVTQVYNGSGNARIVASGSTGGMLEVVDNAGAADDKVLRLEVDGGVGWFASVTDDQAGYTVNDILSMDLGTGRVGIGTASPGSALDVNGHIAMRVQGADPGTAANTGHVYVKDVASSGEVFVQDEAGNATQISPHDPETGEWIFYSENVKTGRKVRINMERMIRKLEEVTGEKFIEESEVTNHL